MTYDTHFSFVHIMPFLVGVHVFFVLVIRVCMILIYVVLNVYMSEIFGYPICFYAFKIFHNMVTSHAGTCRICQSIKFALPHVGINNIYCC